MFTSLVPGLIVAAITILILRLVLGFLFRPPGAQSFKTKLIRVAAHLSVRVERLWKDHRRSRFQRPRAALPKSVTEK
jgi:hypothetical protein